MTLPLPKELHDRLLQMLGEKCFGLFPGVFRRCFMIARSLVTEKPVGRFGIDFHREVFLLISKLGSDLIHVIRRNERIFPAKEKIDWTG